MTNNKNGLEEKKYDQNQYNKTWEEKNKEKSNYLKSRTTARSFIKNKATVEDLEELQELMNRRKEVLNEA